MIPLRDNVPARGFPLITVTLIAISLVAFLWQLTLSDSRASTFNLAQAGVSERDAATIERGAIPFRLTHPGSHCGATAERIVCGEGALTTVDDSELVRVPRNLRSPATWTTPISSLFMHVDLLHLVVNMLFLLIFGRTLEASLGRGRFALFYLGAGLAAIGLQTLFEPNAADPIIGASGAVAGVLGAYAVSYPRARIVGLALVPLFATPVEFPAIALVVAWFLLQLIPGVAQLATPDAAEGALAYVTCVATFALGAAAARLLIREPIGFERPRTAIRSEPVRG